MKCYNKKLNFIVPIIRCNFCKKHIKSGENLYTVVLIWGNGKSACEKCYNMFEIDWSMREKKKENKKVEEFLKKEELELK